MADLIIRNIYQQVLDYLRGIWRHRWYFAVMAWIVCGAGWTMVYLMPYEYMASASVSIANPQSEITPFLQNVKLTYDVSSGAGGVLTKMMNRANLLQVVRQSDLAEQIQSPEELERAIDRVRASLTTTPERGGNLWTIACRLPQPRVAYQVVQGLIDILMQQNMDQAARNQARTAQKFLDQQIKEYETKLTQTEADLRDFRKKNSHMLGDQEGGYYGRLKTLTQKLEDQKGHRAELLKRREELLRQKTSLEAGPNSAANDLDNEPPHTRKIRELENALRDLREKFITKGGRRVALYPDGHPDVVAIQHRIEDLRKARAEAERKQLEARQNIPAERSNDPVYQRLHMSLNEADVEMASTEARIQEFESQLEEMRRLETALPVVEGELLRLQRQHEFLKQKLSNLMGQQSEARFTGDVIENLSKEVEFKIASTPSIPRKPVGPNRPLFYTVVLLGGIAAGLALSFFLTLIRPVFDNPVTLKKELGLPVLGTVSYVMGSSERSWLLGNTSFTFIVLLLVGAYVGVMLPTFI